MLNVTRNKQKKHNKVVVLAKRKLNSNDTLMSQVSKDLDISHEEFKTIVNARERYEQMKESIRNIKSSVEKDEFNGNIKENIGNTQT